MSEQGNTARDESSVAANKALDYPDAAPNRDAFLSFLRAGICPYCQRGPFVKITPHLTRRHDLSIREVKNLAGLRMKDPIVSPEYSEQMRQRNLDMGIRPGPEAFAALRGVEHIYTDAGRAIQAAKVAPFTADPEHQAAASRQASREARVHAARLGGAASGPARLGKKRGPYRKRAE